MTSSLSTRSFKRELVHGANHRCRWQHRWVVVDHHMAIEGRTSDVIVVEPDPAYEFAAAPRSAGGIRLMYGLPENIEMSRYGRVFRNFANLMDVDGALRCVRLPSTWLSVPCERLTSGWRTELSCEVQRQAGVTNDLVDKNLLAARFSPS